MTEINCSETAAKADMITTHVLQTFAYLQELDDKTPQSDLNGKLTKLVSLVSPVYEYALVQSVLADVAAQCDIGVLTEKLGECEYALEKHWAGKVINGDASYPDYPYYNCYQGITAAETTLLKTEMAIENKSLCFVGSGPMPMTAMVLKDSQPTVSITCIEREREAMETAREVCQVSGIDIVHELNEANEADYSRFDAIFLASMTEGKEDVMKRIVETARPGTLVAARTVDDLRHLLYMPIQEATLPQEMLSVGRTPYNPEHVNTTMLLKLQ